MSAGDSYTNCPEGTCVIGAGCFLELLSLTREFFRKHIPQLCMMAVQLVSLVYFYTAYKGIKIAFVDQAESHWLSQSCDR